MQLILQLIDGGSLTAATQSEAQVVAHAQVWVERVALEHHGHVALGGAQLAHSLIADPDFSGTG